MKEKRILDALNDIDERYIEDAAPGKRRSPKRPLYTRLVKAAVLVLLLTGALFWAKGRFGNSGSSEATTAAGIPETLAAVTEAAVTEAAIEAQTERTEQPAEETASQEQAAYDASFSEAETVWEQTLPQTGAHSTAAPTEEAELETAAATKESIPAAVPSLKEGDPASKFFDFYCPSDDCVRIEVLYADTGDDSVIYNEKAIAALYALLSPCKCQSTKAQEADGESPLLSPFSSTSVGFTIAFSEGSFRCGRYRFELPASARTELMQLLEK